jgi:hypothetical protein
MIAVAVAALIEAMLDDALRRPGRTATAWLTSHRGCFDLQVARMALGPRSMGVEATCCDVAHAHDTGAGQ